VNVYSFALQPEQHQPSGTCNFSRIDNAVLQLTISNNAVGTNVSSTVRVYATNYNVLRIMSGIEKAIAFTVNYIYNCLSQTAGCLVY
jgi:hypothetical protein